MPFPLKHLLSLQKHQNWFRLIIANKTTTTKKGESSRRTHKTNKTIYVGQIKLMVKSVVCVCVCSSLDFFLFFCCWTIRMGNGCSISNCRFSEGHRYYPSLILQTNFIGFGNFCGPDFLFRNSKSVDLRRPHHQHHHRHLKSFPKKGCQWW